MKLSTILTLAAVGVGGYLLYSWVTTPVAAAPGTPAAPGTAPPASPPATVVTPPAPGLVQQLISAATGDVDFTNNVSAGADGSNLENHTLTADQWSFYYGQLSGRTPIPPGVFGPLFFPVGRPTNGIDAQMTAQDFVTAIATKGLSGLGGVASYQIDGMAAYSQPGACYLDDGFSGSGLGAVVARAYKGRGHAYGRLGMRPVSRLPRVRSAA